MERYSVRQLGHVDAAAARDLILETFTELSGPEVIATWYGDVRAMTESYVENPQQAAFIAVAGERVIGVAVVRHRRPAIAPLSDRYDPETTCELGRVAVRPEFRSQGVARALVEAARDWARGQYLVISLHAATDNERALRFWRSICIEVYSSPDVDSVYFEIPLQSNTSPWGITSQREDWLMHGESPRGASWPREVMSNSQDVNDRILKGMK